MPKLVLISRPDNLMCEHDTIAELFDQGLDHFHVRKPDLTERELFVYLSKFPRRLRDKVILHGNAELARQFDVAGLHLPVGKEFGDWSGKRSRSLHSIEELENINEKLDYVFLSPIFDAISKPDYKAAFDEPELAKILSKKRDFDVVALGGITAETAEKSFELGFDGVASLGFVWNELITVRLLAKFNALKAACLLTAHTS